MVLIGVRERKEMKEVKSKEGISDRFINNYLQNNVEWSFFLFLLISCVLQKQFIIFCCLIKFKKETKTYQLNVSRFNLGTSFFSYWIFIFGVDFSIFEKLEW